MDSATQVARLLRSHGATESEQQQALVAYLHSIRADLLGGVLFRNPYIGYHHGMFDAATLLKKGVDNRTSLPGLPLPACELWESLAIAATVIRHVHTSTDKTMTVGHATFLAGSSQRWVRWDASTAEAAAALEAYQRAAGFDPLLTAAQLREVATLLAMQHSENCGNLLQQAEQAGVPYDLSHGNPGQQLWRPAAACCSCSLTALPHTCTMLCCLSR
ncbi:orotidine 5 -phosphate decarboxylase [Micractinium conductrix]|uniref:Orotidine 5 -phosphate decarboxylase n=1 Tax=Micractinium conductrix TaxID=554055 RepID=A0A2P6V4D9_9CHLO|nr:orotidine 5 -phosphate decarboxylase [Micractinium conductrix]|eukprot:PSC68948.1 orotidine 5 -phosphate decarboxylase [Micractinium conductrix]